MGEKILRSWGSYEVLHAGRDFKLKQLNFEPGKMLSLQKHFNREEFWMFTAGEGLMTVTPDLSRAWKNANPVREGDFVYINKERYHSFIAKTQTTVIELQIGECREDDIVRFDQPDWAPKS